ncbi:MAG: AAA family ATPase [Clostridia bacterium]|nr:AAA family ATPase [Clostridia bacterium]
MKISEITIKNYRNIEGTSFESEGTTIFIGENNSGKSNILRALSLPLYSEDNTISKHLTWDDINSKARNEYFKYLETHRDQIVEGSLLLDDFIKSIPVVSVEIHFTPETDELYYVKDIAFKITNNNIQYGLLYRFTVDMPSKLLEYVKEILSDSSVNISDVKRNLLPISLYTYSIVVPEKEVKVAYDVLRYFKYTMLPAERDGFSYDNSKIGYKSLVKLLESRYSNENLVHIEKQYQTFFDEVKKAGDVDSVLNWQDYSSIPGAKDFISSISILPNMPPLSTILNGVKLGYADESLSLQGLGYRNLILLLVLLNSWKEKQCDTVINVLIMEEPEAHLCINNIRLMCSFINALTKDNKSVQLIFSSHSTEFLNKHALESVVVLDAGEAYALSTELNDEERNYLSKNPNTDIYKLFLSHRCILVEGITEELFIKAYQASQSTLGDIDVLSFHKGFTKIIEIWQKTNSNCHKRLGIVRDYDNQPAAQANHEKYNSCQSILVTTTKNYTLEPEIVKTGSNYTLLQSKYGTQFGWTGLTQDQLSDKWRSQKAEVMLTISHDIANGSLVGLQMPAHIQAIFDFMAGKKDDN